MNAIIDLGIGIGMGASALMAVACVVFAFKFIRAFDRVAKPQLRDGPLPYKGKIVDGYAISDDALDKMIHG